MKINVATAAHAGLVAALLCGCAAARDEGVSRVTGTVSYQERIALPANAQVRVSLLDVSRQDVAAMEVARVVIETGGRQVPIDFEIPYDASKIDERHNYAVRAEIGIDNDRRFMSTSHYPVLTYGAPAHVDIRVVQAPVGAQPPAVSSRLVGMYSYMADAGLFVECGTNKRVPVVMEGDNVALERAYLAARAEPNQQVLVTLNGRYAQRPRMEGKGTREMLVVDRFERAWPDETCEKSTVSTPLENTYWKLVELNGVAVVPAPGQTREAHLQLRPQEQRAQGFTGCNSFTGGYRIKGGALSFGEIAATKMLCPDMEPEQAYLMALEATTGYEILGETLLLTHESDVIARFRAVYFE